MVVGQVRDADRCEPEALQGGVAAARCAVANIEEEGRRDQIGVRVDHGDVSVADVTAQPDVAVARVLEGEVLRR